MAMVDNISKKNDVERRMCEFIDDLLESIDDILKKKGTITKDMIAKLKIRLSEKHGLKKIPSDIEILISLDKKRYNIMKRYLYSKPTRNISGVQVVAIMSKPHNCPHGTCIMCPGGLNSPFGDVPKSYTGNEPATMRAIRNFYDPYLQVFNRLEQYVLLGIYPQKIELILMGGTFLFLDKEYKEDFVMNAYKAMNDFSRMFYKGDTFLLNKFKSFFELPHKKDDKVREDRIIKKLYELKSKDKKTLKQEQMYNDYHSKVKCVGFTIETKPDYGKHEHGIEMLSYGTTRVELGVQTLYDKGLKAMNRGHTLKDTEDSIRDLRNLGFKLNFHIMFGVPGLTRQEEKDSMKWFFTDERWRPDMVKLYPLMVMPGTGLEKLYRQGKYKPIRTKEAAEMISEFKRHVQPYCRIMRVQRDIPPKYSIDGVDRSNLRQYINVKCRCIRCREIGRKLKENPQLRIVSPQIVVNKYHASSGLEYFISIEEYDSIIGFVRLRIVNNIAFIRELHVYGTTALLGRKGAIQHMGFGKQLMKKAEEIAKENKAKIIRVISGIGVRQYYRKLGYKLRNNYMVKRI